MSAAADEHLFQRSMTVLEVTDMTQSIAFYRDKLGFAVSEFGDPSTFTIAQRGTVTIALDSSRRCQASNNQYWAAYIYVSDVERVYKEFLEHKVPIHRDIQDTDYGLRDFDVIDPDGYLIAIGQPLNMHPDHLAPGIGSDRSRDANTTTSAS